MSRQPIIATHVNFWQMRSPDPGARSAGKCRGHSGPADRHPRQDRQPTGERRLLRRRGVVGLLFGRTSVIETIYLDWLPKLIDFPSERGVLEEELISANERILGLVRQPDGRPFHARLMSMRGVRC